MVSVFFGVPGNCGTGRKSRVSSRRAESREVGIGAIWSEMQDPFVAGKALDQLESTERRFEIPTSGVAATNSSNVPATVDFMFMIHRTAKLPSMIRLPSRKLSDSCPACPVTASVAESPARARGAQSRWSGVLWQPLSRIFPAIPAVEPG
jgi:hypothetical protein